MPNRLKLPAYGIFRNDELPRKLLCNCSEVITFFMQSDELWQSLCEQAAKEGDPEKLLELAKEISRLLDEKNDWLKKARQRSA